MGPQNDLVILSPVEEIEKHNLLMLKRIMSGNSALYAEKYFEFSTRESRRELMFLQNQNMKSLPMRESFFIRSVNSWNSIKDIDQTLPYERFKIFARNFVVNKHRAETLPNNSAAVQARIPVISA